MNYIGTIVEESLKDNRFLNNLDVVSIRILSAEKPNERWHLYKVRVDESKIEELSHQLKQEKWYMHFWHGDDIVAVFPDKTFRMQHSNQSTWAQAIEYGKSLNIPEEQLDFIVE